MIDPISKEYLILKFKKTNWCLNPRMGENSGNSILSKKHVSFMQSIKRIDQ